MRHSAWHTTAQHSENLSATMHDHHTLHMILQQIRKCRHLAPAGKQGMVPPATRAPGTRTRAPSQAKIVKLAGS